MPDFTLVYATHPGIDGVAQMPRAALDGSGWSELVEPRKSARFRAAAEKDPALEAAVTTQKKKPAEPVHQPKES